MILSKLTPRPDPHSARTLAQILPRNTASRALGSHRLMYDLFGARDGATVDYLWREDHATGSFYTLSKRTPADERGLFEVATRPFQPRLRAGHVAEFALRVNAVISKLDGTRDRARREDVLTRALRNLRHDEPHASDQRRSVACADALLDWFERQGEKHGFRPFRLRRSAQSRHGAGEQPAFSVEKRGFVRVPRKSGDNAQFGVADLTGAVEVTDADAFVAAMARGFGRSKAYGCGLMLVRPAR